MYDYELVAVIEIDGTAVEEYKVVDRYGGPLAWYTYVYKFKGKEYMRFELDKLKTDIAAAK